jgi:hypothetical protein
LVYFFDFAQLNSLRALPYVGAWRERYSSAGLGVLGVHSPRFTFTRPPEAVAAALPGLGVEWPVATDGGMAIFRAYGCHGWPSLFLWGRGGALRWHHLGEGSYAATEEAIREALGDPPGGGWPEPLDPLRPADAAGAGVVAPTPELFPGGSIERPWRAGVDGDELQLPYAAAEAHAAVEGSGELIIEVDGRLGRTIEVRGPGLYELEASEHHGSHLLLLRASPGLAIHSVQFAAGPPAPQTLGPRG